MYSGYDSYGSGGMMQPDNTGKYILFGLASSLSIGSNYLLYKYTGPDYDQKQFEDTVNQTDERNFLMTSFGLGLILFFYHLFPILFKIYGVFKTGNLGGMGGYGGYDSYGGGYDSYGGMGGMGRTNRIGTILNWSSFLYSASAVISSGVVLGYKYIWDFGPETWSIVGNNWRMYSLVALASNILVVIGIAMYGLVFQRQIQKTENIITERQSNQNREQMM